MVAHRKEERGKLFRSRAQHRGVMITTISANAPERREVRTSYGQAATAAAVAEEYKRCRYGNTTDVFYPAVKACFGLKINATGRKRNTESGKSLAAIMW